MRRNIIIGFSLGFNTAACVIHKHKGVLFAIQEERLINEKNTKKFPLRALIECKRFLKNNGYDIEKELDHMAYSHYQDFDIHDLIRHSAPDLVDGLERQYSVEESSSNMEAEENFIKAMVRLAGIPACEIIRIAHHYAHAMCAYALSGFANDDAPAIVVTMDGFGDGESATIHYALGSFLDQRASLPLKSSFGLVYQFVTGAFGMKEHQHEGKVTGLAAHGHFIKEYANFFKSLIHFYDTDIEASWVNSKEILKTNARNSPIEDFDHFLALKDVVYGFVKEQLSRDDSFQNRADIAHALQNWCENSITTWIQSKIMELGLDVKSYNLCLAGGVFANVKINQHIKNNLGVKLKNIFVAPPMGDEGTCIGSAYAVRDMHDFFFKTYHDMSFGTEFDTIDAMDMLLKKGDEYKISIQQLPNWSTVNEEIAHLVNQNKVVCLFRGRLEFGPRALLGRTILYNCREKGTNDWLNKRLGRTEYMPFAPFIKEEHLCDLFWDPDKARNSLDFMTMTLDCKPEFVENYPAATHVDNTARPQVVSSLHNPEAWDILDRYERITGEKALINTSFNIHGYPNIATMERAFDDWYKSGLDVLVLENVIIYNLRNSVEE